jgi:hypothetical protein
MYTHQKAMTRISIMILILSVLAVLAAFFWPHPGNRYAFTTLRGEEVTIFGSGLYRYETISIYAQTIAQDMVTLIVAIPVLLISLLMANRGSMRGRVLLTGTLAYFLYTYASYSFLSAYNEFFLVDVALFSLSLFGVIFAFMSITPVELSGHIQAGYPRRGLGIFCISIGSILGLMWLGRIVPALVQHTAPVGLENASTLVIQAFDLGLIVPLGFLSGILLLRNEPWGYLLGSIFLFKGTTLVLAVFAMGLNMLRMGVADASLIEVAIFGTFALLAVLFSMKVIRNIQ